MTNNSGRVTTRQHYEAIMSLRQEGEERERRLGEKIDKGFSGLESKLGTRMDKMDERIDTFRGRSKEIPSGLLRKLKRGIMGISHHKEEIGNG